MSNECHESHGDVMARLHSDDVNPSTHLFTALGLNSLTETWDPQPLPEKAFICCFAAFDLETWRIERTGQRQI